MENQLAKTLFNRIPAGIGALFFIQIFSTLGFAVLYSTLELYMTQGLKLSSDEATTILGGFIAFNYGLHLLGGYFGGRYLSFRSLFIIGMVFQVIGCFILSKMDIDNLLWGMALFLTGSGLNVTCINMMVTQAFTPDDKRRESAFLWNYSGMNLGFWIGYIVAGFYQQTANYHTLFLLSCIGNAIAIVLTFLNWPKLKDRDTPISLSTGRQYLHKYFLGIVTMILMVPIIHKLLQHANFSGKLIIGVGILMLLVILFLAFQQPKGNNRNKMFVYLILAMASVIFWTLYQIIPMGLTLYAEYNVNLQVMGYLITPQWVLNINPTVIIIGGPLLTVILAFARKKGYPVSIAQLFTTSLFCIALGFSLLTLGIHFASQQGLASFHWIFWSYILQSIGELLISPIGYAMIGQLAPKQLTSLLMGTWMMCSGVASVLASYNSNIAIANSTSNSPLITNAGYSAVFTWLSGVAFLCGITLLILRPFLHRMMSKNNQ